MIENISVLIHLYSATVSTDWLALGK